MEYRVNVSNAIKNQFEHLAKNISRSSDPSQVAGGLLVGKVNNAEGSPIISVENIIIAETQHNFLDELKFSSRLWKDIYDKKRIDFPNFNILGWFILGPTANKPGAIEFDIHKSFFAEHYQILMIASDDLISAYNAKDEDFFPIPVIFADSMNSSQSSYEGHEPQKMGPPNEVRSAGLSEAIKKVMLLTTIFFICVLSIMYKDLTAPINSDVQDPVAGIEEVAQNTYASNEGLTETTSENIAENITENKTETDEIVSETDNGSQNTIDVNTDGQANNLTVQRYVVKKGDSLWSISEKYYGSGFMFYKIMRENKVVNPNSLHVGQRLIIPVE